METFLIVGFNFFLLQFFLYFVHLPETWGLYYCSATKYLKCVVTFLKQCLNNNAAHPPEILNIYKLFKWALSNFL